MPARPAEPWHIWRRHPELAHSVDLQAIHLLPCWEGVSVVEAPRSALDRYDAVNAAYLSKPIVIGEIGWHSDGVVIRAARDSRINHPRPRSTC